MFSFQRWKACIAHPYFQSEQVSSDFGLKFENDFQASIIQGIQTSKREGFWMFELHTVVAAVLEFCCHACITMWPCLMEHAHLPHGACTLTTWRMHTYHMEHAQVSCGTCTLLLGCPPVSELCCNLS